MRPPQISPLFRMSCVLGAGVMIGYWFKGSPTTTPQATLPTNGLTSTASTNPHESVNYDWLDLLHQHGPFSELFLNVLGKIPVADIPQILGELPRLPILETDELLVRNYLWNRLMSEDSEQAYQYLVWTVNLRGENDVTLYHFFKSVAEKGWLSLKVYLMRKDCQKLRSSAMFAAFPVLRKTDPESIPEFLAQAKAWKIKVETESEPTIRDDFPNLVTTNHQEALERFLARPELARDVNSLSLLLRHWPDSATESLLELHENLVRPELLTIAEQAIAVRLAKQNTVEAVAWINSLPQTRQLLVAQSIREHLLLNDPLTAQKFFTAAATAGQTYYRPAPHFSEVPGAIHRFILANPEKAREWITTFPNGPLNLEVRGLYLTFLMSQNPDEARNFALQDPDPVRATQALGKMMLSPDQLRKFLNPLPEPLRQNAALAFVRRFPLHDWHEAETNGVYYAPMLELLNVPTDGSKEHQDRMQGTLKHMAVAAAKLKPAETISWLQGQPDTFAGPIFSQIFASWTKSSDTDALNWLQQNGDSLWKDRALIAAAEAISFHDPTKAVQLLEQVSQVPNSIDSALQSCIKNIEVGVPNGVSPILKEKLFPAAIEP